MAVQTNIYDGSVYFSLQYENSSTLILEPASSILEPMNWDKMVNSMPRDKNARGFQSDFIEDKYGLTFSFLEGGGGQILKDIYDQVGEQAVVYFSIGYTGKKPIKTWRVNLEEYELLDGSDTLPFGGVMAAIEKMPFQGKLKSRFNAPCTINSYIGMDGELLTPISVNTLRLHSKTIKQETIANSSSPQTTEESTASFFDSYLIIQPDQQNLVINELNEVFTQPAGILNTDSRIPASAGTPASPNGSGIYISSGVLAEPFASNISQYNPTTNGVLNISWSGGGPNTAFYYYKIGSINNYWTITPRVVVTRLIGGAWAVVSEIDGTTQTISCFAQTGVNPTAPMIGTYPFSIATAGQAYILPSVTGASPRSDVAQVKGFAFAETFNNIEVVAGDNVFVHFILCTNGTTKIPDNGWMQVDNFFNTVTYTQLTTTPGTTADGYRAFDVINQMIENITGQKNALVSTFFAEEGFGHKYLLTNGYALRNFNSIINQPKKSLQSLINDLQAIFFIGWGISEVRGIEYFRVEYAPDFFRRRVIARYENTFDWKDKHNSSVCYNQIELGYNKWQGINLVMEDEYNTNGKYLTQFLKYGDNPLSKMSDTIGSGYMIEEQRRNQFNLNSSQSLTEDESWFIIATSEPNKFHALPSSFDNTDSRVGFFVSSMALQEGDKFSYTVPDWVSNVSYLENFVVNDPTHGFYRALHPIKSTTAPHLDATNWVSGGGLNNGVIFTVVSEVPGFPAIGEDVYNVTPAPTNEIFGLFDMIITPPSPNQIFAERNQPFKICEGVIDPSTIYNGRISPKHILYNWMPLLGVGLYKINPASKDYAVSQIVPTLVKMNSNFTSQFLDSEINKGNVGDNILNEFARENISAALKHTQILFSPIESSTKLRVGWNEVDRLRKNLAMEAEVDATDIGGGLELRDSSGDLWFCHVMDLKYDLVKEILTLTVQKVVKIAS